MGKKLFFFLLAAFAFGWAGAQTQGGPDAYGYVWRSSDDANGPTYNWVDITGQGTQLTGFADDNAVGPLNIGFNFQWFWNTYDELKVGSNGWMSFKTSTGNIAHCFPNFPAPGGNSDNYLGPFMTDLNFAGAANPGEVWYWSNNVDTFIISYINAPWWVQGNPDYIGSNTFQVILSGVDSSVTFQYEDMDQTNLNNTTFCNVDLNIGYENVTGNIGSEIFLETVPQDNYAIKLYYPSVVTLQIQDPTPLWNANIDNAGQFYLTGGNVNLTANIANQGNVTVSTPTTASAEVRDLPLNTVYTASATVDSIPANGGQTVTFSPAWNLTAPGQYYYQVSSSNSNDINPSNNDNIVEISAVAVDTNTCTVGLTYSTGNPPDGQIAWSGGGGDDGVGIEIVPPGYPAVVQSVDMFIRQGAFNVANNSAFDVEVYDDDGPNGAPGTLLGSETVAQGAYTPESWVNIPLSTPITINDGSFYVSWIMGGDSISIGTEAIGPISRRTYEILSGSWATYRQSTVEDFLIQANVDGCAIGFEEEISAVTSFENFPNPTNGVENVRFELLQSGTANFNVVNIHGQTVFHKVYGPLGPGTHQFSFGTEDFTPGIYFLTMEVNGKTVTNKMLVNR